MIKKSTEGFREKEKRRERVEPIIAGRRRSALLPASFQALILSPVLSNSQPLSRSSLSCSLSLPFSLAQAVRPPNTLRTPPVPAKRRRATTCRATTVANSHNRQRFSKPKAYMSNLSKDATSNGFKGS